MKYKEALEILNKPNGNAVMLINALKVLKKYAEIGIATECAMKDGSRFTVFNGEVEDVIKFYKREYE